MVKKLIASALVAVSLVAGTTIPSSKVNAATCYGGCGEWHGYYQMEGDVYQVIGIRYTCGKKGREGYIKHIHQHYCSFCLGLLDQEVEYYYLSEKECNAMGLNLDSVKW